MVKKLVKNPKLEEKAQLFGILILSLAQTGVTKKPASDICIVCTWGRRKYERARFVINMNCGFFLASILRIAFSSINAYFFQDDRPRNPQPADKSKRRCDRCGRTYSVDEDGLQTNEEECVYHWGRKYRMRGSRATGPVHQYSCCSATADADGCQVSSCHFAEMQGTSNMWARSV